VLLLCRRPRAHRANGIGIWLPILSFLSILAVFTNTAVLLLSSRALRELGLSPRGLAYVCLAVEHTVFLFKIGLARLIPDTPLWVEAEKARRAFFVRKLQLEREVNQAQEDAKVASDQDMEGARPSGAAMANQDRFDDDETPGSS